MNTRGSAKSSNPTDSRLAGLQFGVYARGSTDDARHEDHTSVARQIASARLFVEQGGGEILENCVYVDEAASGAEFEERNGLKKLVADLQNGHPFNALVMMDEDRLGRQMQEVYGFVITSYGKLKKDLLG